MNSCSAAKKRKGEDMAKEKEQGSKHNAPQHAQRAGNQVHAFCQLVLMQVSKECDGLQRLSQALFAGQV